MIDLIRAARLRRIVLPLAILALSASAVGAATNATPWTMGGQNLSDTRSNSSSINPQNVVHLALKWKFTTQGDVSATPAVVNGAVYFPDWGGYLSKVDAATGALIWQHKISDYDGVSGAVARTSPAVDGNTVYIGDQNGGNLIAVDATTGLARWSAAIGDSPFSIDTESPVVYQGVVYVGVASSEEGVAAFVPGFVCCTSRGAFAAVDAATGAVLWKRYTVPPGYSGGGVWSSTPAIDPSTRTVYIATGNNYSVPAAAKTCQENGNPPDQCLASDDYVDTILALNMDTGQVKWAHKLWGFDDWNVACIFPFINPQACPAIAGPDYDFGSGPNLFTIKQGSQTTKVVGAGQKSGIYWLLNAATGKTVWKTQGGPGSTLGGIEWGTAVDGKGIYAAETNYNRTVYTTPSGQTINYGSWVALDPASGQVLWQTPDPNGAIDLGPTAVANGVVYAGSLSGDMYALDANTGNVLWQYHGAGASAASPAIVDGTVYWGNGYNHLGIPEGSPSNTFYAFSVNGN